VHGIVERSDCQVRNKITMRRLSVDTRVPEVGVYTVVGI